MTGAARGIGKAIALKFASEGANIAFTDLAIDENAQATEKEIAALGVKVKGYASNAANFDETHQVVEEIVKDFGGVDILVNNAGIIKRIPMEEMSVEDFRQVIDVDRNAPFIMSKAVIPGMKKKGHGKIINICSMMRLRPLLTTRSWVIWLRISAKTPLARTPFFSNMKGSTVMTTSS